MNESRGQDSCVNPLIVQVVVHFESGNISNQCMIEATLAQIDQLNADFIRCNMNAGLLCEWIYAGCDNFGGLAGANLRVIDLGGKALKEINISKNSSLSNLRIDVSAFEAGVYFVQMIINEGEIETKKSETIRIKK